MKKIISILSLFIFCLIASSCGAITGDFKYNFSYLNSDMFLFGNATIENTSDLNKLHLRWYDGNITIRTHDQDSIIIEETIVPNLQTVDNDRKVHYYYNDGTLLLEYGKSGIKNYDNISKDVVITIPQNNNYDIGITSYSADVTLSMSNYENQLDELTISTTCGAVYCNIDRANIVQIAGYSYDSDEKDNRNFVFNGNYVNKLSFNSSYAEVQVNVREVGSFNNVGSVFEKTIINVDKIKHVELEINRAESFITIIEFDSMDLKFRDEKAYLYLPTDIGFTIKADINKVQVNFDNVKIDSDNNEYVVLNGEKSISIYTENMVYVNQIN